MLSQDESAAFWEGNDGDQCISSLQEHDCVDFEVKKKSLKGESLTFVGFYPTDFRPVSSADVQEKLFFFKKKKHLCLNSRLA